MRVYVRRLFYMRVYVRRLFYMRVYVRRLFKFMRVYVYVLVIMYVDVPRELFGNLISS